MTSRTALAAFAGFALLASLSACKSSSTATGSTPPVAAGATTSPVATPASAPASTRPSGGSTAAATTKEDPCVLVTSADATAALGAPAGAPQGLSAGLYQSCVYAHGTVVVLVRNIDKATFDKSAAANPGGAKPLSGVGQDAYTTGGDVLVWQNGTEIVLQVHGGSDPVAAEKQLATAAVGRL